MTFLEEVKAFATQCHKGQKRKITNQPYIEHPIEVCEIIKTLTDDENVCAAGLLHDVVEDCGVDPNVIKEKFGDRVYALVMCETEDRFYTTSMAESWEERKADSLLFLKFTKDIDVKKLWLGDKLSNMRSFYKSYLEIGDHILDYLNQKDKSKHYWYYSTIAEYLIELKDYPAYIEYCDLVEKVWK